MRRSVCAKWYENSSICYVAQPAPQIDLRTRASRERLAKIVVALLDHWQLAVNDQAALLGLSAQSRSTIARYRRGEPFADNADLLARAGHLLGIHKALRIVFPHDRELAYRWVTTANRRFGTTPLEVMKRHGYEGILAVRRYLDFERGR
jgi:hypothetical protein